MATAAAVSFCMLWLTTGPSSAAVSSQVVGFEDGGLARFSKTEVLEGSLDVVSGVAYESTYSALATFAAGGSNGYARGILEVSWVEGDDVWYGAAFYLPPGFYATLDGYLDLMRWDNFTTFEEAADTGGVAIYGSDERARLVTGRYDEVGQRLLAGPFDLPEGRWFWLEVHQTLGTVAGVNEVYLDGQLVGASIEANYAGRLVDRIRFGIVSTTPSTQLVPVSFYFDRAAVGPRSHGPLSVNAPPPSVNAGPQSGPAGIGGGQPSPAVADQSSSGAPGSTSCTVVGTAGDDELVGTPGADVICGRGGDDVLRGGGGGDTLVGGVGRDDLFGGPGRDVLRAGAGADRVSGGGGTDRIAGGGGRDRIQSADRRREKVRCGGGRDTVTADRADRLVGCERVRRR